jgi:hypothetical protein
MLAATLTGNRLGDNHMIILGSSSRLKQARGAAGRLR